MKKSSLKQVFFILFLSSFSGSFSLASGPIPSPSILPPCECAIRMPVTEISSGLLQSEVDAKVQAGIASSQVDFGYVLGTDPQGRQVCEKYECNSTVVLDAFVARNQSQDAAILNLLSHVDPMLAFSFGRLSFSSGSAGPSDVPECTPAQSETDPNVMYIAPKTLKTSVPDTDPDCAALISGTAIYSSPESSPTVTASSPAPKPSISPVASPLPLPSVSPSPTASSAGHSNCFDSSENYCDHSNHWVACIGGVLTQTNQQCGGPSASGMAPNLD